MEVTVHKMSVSIRNDMENTGDIEPAILRFKGGSLRIFGDWFGKPHDNRHKPKSVVLEPSRLIVTFDEDETLTVDKPKGIVVVEAEFRIQRAEKVRWE